MVDLGIPDWRRGKNEPPRHQEIKKVASDLVPPKPKTENRQDAKSAKSLPDEAFR
jgi:hypothetical protein